MECGSGRYYGPRQGAGILRSESGDEGEVLSGAPSVLILGLIMVKHSTNKLIGSLNISYQLIVFFCIYVFMFSGQRFFSKITKCCF